MIMIIGGAYQGKHTFAKELYPDIIWADGKSCSEKELKTAQGVVGFHHYIERMIRAGESAEHLAKELTKENPELIIVTDEIGYGIVPIDKVEREYRETTGRVCTELAAFSEKVYRVTCGIGQLIKR